MRPRQLFTVVARAEVVTWALLLLGMFLKYVTQTTELGVRIFGLLHGVVFLAYVLVSLVLWTNHRWRSTILLRALVAGVVPFATLWFERWAKKRNELSGDWRFGRNGSYAYSPQERVLAWSVRHPFLAVFGAGIVIGGTTAALLMAGPPTEWFSALTANLTANLAG